MDFELRSLCSDDIFSVCQILSDIGFENIQNHLPIDKLKAAMGSDADAATVGVAVALPIAGMILSNLGKCKSSLYAFLASVSGLSAAKVAKLKPADFAKLVFAVFQNEDFKDFFTVVLNVFNQSKGISN